jgi:hypothetical protein
LRLNASQVRYWVMGRETRKAQYRS